MGESDYQKYKDILDTLKTPEGLKNLSNETPEKRAELIDAINKFLNVQKEPPKTLPYMSIQNIGTKSIKTLIDIINDISDLLSNRHLLSNTDFRRQLFKIFTQEDRREAVGILLVLIAIVIFLIS